jgi:hypothetical protein
MLQILEFILNLVLLLATNKRKEKLYCDLRYNISTVLNKLLEESVPMHALVIIVMLILLLPHNKHIKE